MGRELKETKGIRKIKKNLKRTGRNATYHNQFCVIMGMYKELR